MTEDIAHQIYDILAAHAGADAAPHSISRRQFITFMTRPTMIREYRFVGNLGFGGKFHDDGHRWRVGCYREDDTPERDAIIERTNAALAEFRDQVYAELEAS